jgi:hypothetical protein
MRHCRKRACRTFTELAPKLTKAREIDYIRAVASPRFTNREALMRRLFTVTFVAAAVALAAVAGAAASIAAPQSGSRTAGLNISFGFDYLDPALAYTQPSWQVLQATCLKLVNFADAPSAGRLDRGT